jgi:hypothetical protein
MLCVRPERLAMCCGLRMRHANNTRRNRNDYEGRYARSRPHEPAIQLIWRSSLCTDDDDGHISIAGTSWSRRTCIICSCRSVTADCCRVAKFLCTSDPAMAALGLRRWLPPELQDGKLYRAASDADPPCIVPRTLHHPMRLHVIRSVVCVFVGPTLGGQYQSGWACIAEPRARRGCRDKLTIAIPAIYPQYTAQSQARCCKLVVVIAACGRVVTLEVTRSRATPSRLSGSRQIPQWTGSMSCASPCSKRACVCP